MAAVYILIFGEMAGFKIVPFIPTHVKMIFFSWSYDKKVQRANLQKKQQLILNYL